MGRLSRVRTLYRDRPRPFRSIRKWTSHKGHKVSVKRNTTAKKWSRKQRNKIKGAGRKAWERRRKHFREKIRFHKRKRDKVDELPTDGTTTYDGERVPNWMIPILNRARASGLWAGVVISGVRTPEYSESLCYGICGAPTCPGRCAGRASNHNATDPVTDGEGAVDVTDEVGLKRALVANGDDHLLKNTIGPSDPNHMSRGGR